MVVKYVKDFEFPSDKGFTGSAGKMPTRGMGSMTAAEATQADGAAYLMGRDKLRGMGAVTNDEAAQVRRKKLVGAPSLADLKALSAAKAAARMSPEDRFLSGREKLRGMGAVTNAEAKGDYAKGGAAKKSPVVKNPKKAMGGMMHGGYAKGGKPRC